MAPQWWLGTESNRRHEDFQSSALPTELPSPMSYYKPNEGIAHYKVLVAGAGLEPATFGL